MKKKKYISEIPELMKEWDWEANADLDPTKLTIGSNKKAHWICSQCEHKWVTSVEHRALRKHGCPKCHYSPERHNTPNNITITNSEMIKFWDYEKNGKFTPDMFTKGASYNAFWKCPICNNGWKHSIDHFCGCRKCNHTEQISHRSLAVEYPHFVIQWHPTKNGNLTPDQVSAKSQRKVWWWCPRCKFEWQATPANRVRHAPKCPNCETHHTRIVIQGINDLATTHPELAKEWHPTKNGNLKPTDITYGYGKKVWWCCPNGHEFQKTPNTRTSQQSGCPVCIKGRQSSFAEQCVFYYIKKLYPDAVSRYRAPFLKKFELDVYIPSISLAIEYDGIAWHKVEKESREQRKYKICKEHNIWLIRIKEGKNKFKDVADQCYNVKDIKKPKDLERILFYIMDSIDYRSKLETDLKKIYAINRFDIDIKRDEIKILSGYKARLKKGSFAELYPRLLKEWHPNKNKGVDPYSFLPGSGHKVWWICSKCGREYQATIGSRVSGTGCIKCGIEKSAQAKRKSIHMIDPKTNQIIKTFISISDVSRKMKISSGNIAAVCQGIRPKAGGYTWRYANEQEAQKYQKDKKQLEFDFDSKN